MFLQYLNYKENKNKKISQILYKALVEKVLFIISKNKLSIKGDFNSSFEITSIYISSILFALKDKRNKNLQNLSQNLVEIFISDLDYSLRNIGIGDMSIGKYVKKYVKKFYWRLGKLEPIFIQSNNLKFNDFIKNLDILIDTNSPSDLNFLSFADIDYLIKKIKKNDIKEDKLYLLFI